jgi:hypothetical protein
MYTLIITAKMNDIDPQAWLADVLKRLPDMPISRVREPLPWNWKTAAATSRPNSRGPRRMLTLRPQAAMSDMSRRG